MGENRSQAWLRRLLADVWAHHFPDTPRVNVVDITYCRPSKTRLGWIALSESGQSSLIGINRLLRHPDVPLEVCLVTVAHEVVHYCHGFGSPLPRRYPDPHADGVVERELLARGLGDPLRRYETWASASWSGFYARQATRRTKPATDTSDALLGGADVAALDVSPAIALPSAG